MEKIGKNKILLFTKTVLLITKVNDQNTPMHVNFGKEHDSKEKPFYARRLLFRSPISL